MLRNLHSFKDSAYVVFQFISIDKKQLHEEIMKDIQQTMQHELSLPKRKRNYYKRLQQISKRHFGYAWHVVEREVVYYNNLGRGAFVVINPQESTVTFPYNSWFNMNAYEYRGKRYYLNIRNDTVHVDLADPDQRELLELVKNEKQI